MHYAFSADNAVSGRGLVMVRHVIYGALIGRFIMKLVERFTMSFGEFVPAHVEPCALMMHYGNTDRCCGVVRNGIVARRICSYMERNHPSIAPNFSIDERFFRPAVQSMYVAMFRAGKIRNIGLFSENIPLIAHVPLCNAMFSLPPIIATH